MDRAHNNSTDFLSSMPGVAWPGIVPQPGRAALALQFQLGQSQWWPQEEIERSQLHQLRLLLAHAVQTVPFYRERLRGFDPGRDALTAQAWRSLPCLTRDEIQAHRHVLSSTAPPQAHGKPFERWTSGSSGKPIQVLGTPVTQFFWNGITLRDHLWHGRDFRAKLGVIRSKIRSGARPDWGPPSAEAFVTGPSALLNIEADIETQAAWLQAQNPAYLLTHPSNLYALARHCLEHGIGVPGLRGLRTFGEMLKPDLRELCRAAWGVGLTDTYSAEEVGYMALQCPEHEHYHVQSETVLVEVLDDAGRPCAPGEVGRVVVTPLHNFAMPLLRYQILDYAEVGAPCPCGRGLPVLSRIVGRQRNMITLPDGRRHWPSFPSRHWLEIAPVRQFQLVQRERDALLVRLAAARPLTRAEEERLAGMLVGQLGHPFRIAFEYHDSIARTRNSKYEDFISELA